MRRHPLLLLAPALLGIIGCPTRSKYDQMPTVRITSPTIATTYTNNTVRITAAIDPIVDLPIVILDNGAKLTTLTTPSYSYDWPTAVAPEGEHAIVAEVALSEGVVRSAPVTIVVDRTPPTLSRTPAPGVKNVALRAPIQATFSEPIVLAQPADATFSLSMVPGPTLATHATIDGQGRVVTIAIDDFATWAPPVTLRATIGAAITDRAGNPLTLPQDEWLWDVPDFVKLPPTPLCPDLPPYNRLPAFAVGPNLRPVIAWAASASSAGSVHCQLQLSQHDGRQWIQMSPLSDDLDSAKRGAALTLTEEGQPIVAWRPSSDEPDPGQIQVAAASETAWQFFPAIVPQPGVYFPIIHPVLRADQQGFTVLVWGAGTPPDRYFMARGTQSGWNQDFGSIPIVTRLPFDSPHFDVAIDVGGDLIVSWISPIDTGHVSRWDGRSWSAAPDIGGMTEPFMAFDSAHAPMIVSAGGPGAFFVHHLIANDWQAMLATAAPPQARHPRLAAGPDGLPVLAWFDAQTKAVGMGRWLGTRWRISAYAFSPSNALDEVPQMVVDRQGTAWVGWRDSANQFNIWMSNF